MFNQNERIILMKKCGKEEAMELHHKYQQLISQSSLAEYRLTLKNDLSSDPGPINDALISPGLLLHVS
ncbi:hypothetical protein [Macrococcus carouselicus]|nr:hypothetical protein [Macrococcus carouselicus]